MSELPANGTTTPDAGEIRAALTRLIADDAFRSSAQIVRFLTYVVEETLAGRGDRIKAYSVATEALGRPPDFDPQADAIVRVEASRLRRALSGYYADRGRDEAVIIQMLPGRYQPVFLRAGVAPTPTPTFAPAPLPAKTHAPSQRLRVIAGIAIVVAVIAVALGARWIGQRGNGAPIGAIPIPTIAVAPFAAANSPNPALAPSLRVALRNALARFDEVEVAAGDTGDPMRRIDYRLDATIDGAPAQPPRVTFRLTDAGAHMAVWTKTFDRLPARFDDDAQTALVREVSTDLADLYSVIATHERAKATFGNLDPRYQCLLDAVAYFRAFDRKEHARIRACLEAVTRTNPTAVRPLILLSRVYLREYYFGGRPPAVEADLLDRAYRAATTAIDIRPQSARAYQALMDVLFVRRELDAALAAGETARQLNPYDVTVLADTGARLVAMGRIEDGLARMREATALSDQRPSWLDFFFVVGAIMAGDTAGASNVATTAMSENYPLTLVCRAALAVQAGDLDAARRDIAALDDSFPAFRANARRELDKIFPSQAIVDRLLSGIAPALRPPR